MYTINETKREELTDCLFQQSMLIASIPEQIIDEQMKEIIQKVLFQSQQNINFLKNLQASKEIDIRDFHQMD